MTKHIWKDEKVEGCPYLAGSERCEGYHVGVEAAERQIWKGCFKKEKKELEVETAQKIFSELETIFSWADNWKLHMTTEYRNFKSRFLSDSKETIMKKKCGEVKK